MQVLKYVNNQTVSRWLSGWLGGWLGGWQVAGWLGWCMPCHCAAHGLPPLYELLLIPALPIPPCC